MTHPNRPQRIPGGYQVTRTMLSTAISMALRDPASVARMFYLEAHVGLLGFARKG